MSMHIALLVATESKNAGPTSTPSQTGTTLEGTAVWHTTHFSLTGHNLSDTQ